MRKVLEVTDLHKLSAIKLKNALLTIGRSAKQFWTQHLRLGNGVTILEANADEGYVLLKVTIRPGEYLIIGDDDTISAEKTVLNG